MDVVKCHNCGYEDYKRWMYEYFVGGTKPIYLCRECYISGITRVDSILNKHWVKKEKERMRKI